MSMSLVRINRFAELTGYTEPAVRMKIQNGVWIDGKHYYRAPDGNILIDTDEVTKWAKENYGKNPNSGQRGH